MRLGAHLLDRNHLSQVSRVDNLLLGNGRDALGTKPYRWLVVRGCVALDLELDDL